MRVGMFLTFRLRSDQLLSSIISDYATANRPRPLRVFGRSRPSWGYSPLARTAKSSANSKISYNEDGMLDARAWVPPVKPFPGIRCVGAIVWAESFVWTGKAWEQSHNPSNAGWGPSYGGELLSKCPKQNGKLSFGPCPNSN